MSSRVLGREEGFSAVPMSWGSAPQAHLPESILPHTEAAKGTVDETFLQEQLSQMKQKIEVEALAAHQRGFRDGEAKAKSTVVAEMQAVIQRMCQAVADLAEIRPRLRREAESDVVRLSLAIARRVLQREMSIDPGSMQALVHVALQRLERQEICRVYVHPNQAAAVKTALDAAGARADVVPEITRPQGTLIFETNHGMLDASVNAQLNEIDRGLTDRVNQS